MTTSPENAWNPGLRSDIPQTLLSQVTLFRNENARVTYPEAKELSDLTGIDVLELVSLRPVRLISHALLVRVTADLTVPDGSRYEELGINLRAMVGTLQHTYIAPLMDDIEAAFDHERKHVKDSVSVLIQEGVSAVIKADVTEVDEKPSLFSRWFGKPRQKAEENLASDEKDLAIVSHWRMKSSQCENVLDQQCIDSLVKCASTIMGHRGRLLPDHDLLTRIVVNQVMNVHGYTIVDAFIDKVWQSAITQEAYRLLPPQEKPVVMNVKGASASGKSTIRPQQRLLAEKLDIPWEDFALISPDYWRKYLLDYASLGEDFKYGAMLTGRELEMIDKRLDRYMADKASNGTMSHLLIDRFRFDSFSVNLDRTADSKLLSRFGDQVYLFFMVTHPAETVERAWSRGQKTGRYKAVDDLLYHNVEAFTGMPALFLSWVNAKDKHIHFEFLDNDVPEGTLPKTAAFGWNNTLVVLDERLLLNVDRYRKVNIAATQPDAIFNADDLVEASNTGFIAHCLKTVDCIVLADQQSMKEYAIVSDGTLVWWDLHYIHKHSDREALHTTLSALGFTGNQCTNELPESWVTLDATEQKRLMVGHWSAR